MAQLISLIGSLFWFKLFYVKSSMIVCGILHGWYQYCDMYTLIDTEYLAKYYHGHLGDIF